MKKFLTLACLLLSSTVFASEYDENYYDDSNEGELLFKVRGFYTDLSTKIKDLPEPKTNSESPKSLIQNGYGLDTASTVFFTDNIATEISLGLNLLRVKDSELKKITAAFGNGEGVIGKKNEIFMIPLTATLQYHIAPFGGIRPYVGGGYHAVYMYTRSKSIDPSHGHGAVAQVGIDFVTKDNSLITFDVRQYFLESKVTFKKDMVSSSVLGSDITGKVKWNPLVISVGFGFKF